LSAAPPPALSALREAARGCTNCPLFRHATQTVFGEGDPHAKLMLVGEQPGDREDLEGHPFVGPAGRLLDEALARAGIDRDAVYVTNAVKHFKWEPRGKRRLHKTPAQREIEACHPWLAGELEAVRPRVVVSLGGTAGRALLGPAFRVGRERGRVIRVDPVSPAIVPTIHPSAILRLRDASEREPALAELVRDLRVAKQAL
jgi:DNA polymerase